MYAGWMWKPWTDVPPERTRLVVIWSKDEMDTNVFYKVNSSGSTVFYRLIRGQPIEYSASNPPKYWALWLDFPIRGFLDL